MKVANFKFEEKPEDKQQFERVETKKGLMEVGVSPYADTIRIDAVDRNAGPGPSPATIEPGE